ncbi:hypothetical protein GW793_00895 [bacterium]|uniref:Uncharacterized protein n=2 Tax=Katanobacteria TaxID=422282 RepID=A0A2M7X4M4_UNCKA|nr:hypothetical protein [bacterium]PIP56841.1 MAG: hypothetical protein COX05_00900 [candidate division WWE3 bacterium CG22_combo_CG10-13_8_21_14_all_39_12]PJA41087.1 MAG: hypothetical protein CO179_00655 [candidate division WWE3 bacterium CG_4_9_14_3_um_filter_39_7]
MLHYVRHHIFQYFLILLLFAITVTSISTPIPSFQKFFFVGVAIIVYFIWAMWHHWEDHSLTKSTLLEYIALAGLLFWLLITLAS